MQSRSTATWRSPPGSSSYKESADGPVVRVYDNCFVMRFDSEGRCREFTRVVHPEEEPVGAADTTVSARAPGLTDFDSLQPRLADVRDAIDAGPS